MLCSTCLGPTIAVLVGKIVCSGCLNFVANCNCVTQEQKEVIGKLIYIESRKNANLKKIDDLLEQLTAARARKKELANEEFETINKGQAVGLTLTRMSIGLGLSGAALRMRQVWRSKSREKNNA